MKLKDLETGVERPGDSGADEDALPTWFNMERFRRGQKFVQDHLHAIVGAWHTALVVGFCVPGLLEALVFTDNTETPEKAQKRYMLTGMHLTSWVTGKMWLDEKEPGVKSIRRVRRMHKAVAKAMSRKLNRPDQNQSSGDQNQIRPNQTTEGQNQSTRGQNQSKQGQNQSKQSFQEQNQSNQSRESSAVQSNVGMTSTDIKLHMDQSMLGSEKKYKYQDQNANRSGKPRTFISQYDMGLVQAGFIGGVLCYPEKFGVRCSRQDLLDYIHMWRVLGYMLGIEDEYNLCTSEDYDKVSDIIKEIEELVIHHYFNPTPDCLRMTEAYIKGMNSYTGLPLTSRDAVMAFSAEISDRYNMIPFKLSWADTVRVWVIKFSIFLVYSVPGMEKLINWRIMENVRALERKEGDITKIRYTFDKDKEI